MKILAIACDLDPDRIGGAEAHFIEVLKRIAPKLEMVTVLVGNSIAIKKVFLNTQNIEIIKTQYPKIPNFSWLSYSLAVIPKSLGFEFDLIWLKQEYLAWCGFFLKLITKKPVYITCQNPNLATEEWVATNKFTKFFQKNFSYRLNAFMMWPLRYADTVAAVSSYSADLAKKYGAKNVIIIPNGVNL